jgi:cobalt-zinc-cadmium efflux system protein
MPEDTNRTNASSKPLLIALFITLGFALLEVSGGFISGSLALLSDAGHMFTDVLALGLSLGAAMLTMRKPTKKHTFGFHRVEILVALLNGITLVVLALLIIVEGLNRFQQPRQVDSSLMLIIAMIGLGANLLGMFILRERTEDNLNVKGAYLHMMGDLLSSVGVIVAAILILLFGLVVADPIISIVIGVVIIIGAYRLVNQSISILLEAVPEHLDLAEVEEALLRIAGIEGIHDVHAWTLTSGVYAMNVHIVVKDRLVSTCSPLLKEVNDVLRTKFQITHTTVQFELKDCALRME